MNDKPMHTTILNVSPEEAIAEQSSRRNQLATRLFNMSRPQLWTFIKKNNVAVTQEMTFLNDEELRRHIVDTICR